MDVLLLLDGWRFELDPDAAHSQLFGLVQIIISLVAIIYLGFSLGKRKDGAKGEY